MGKAGCSSCHTPPLFTDNRFHALGVPQAGPLAEDPGRFAVTGDEADRGAFRTPTLRNVTLTAPYMHDGVLATLDDVIGFYDAGGGPVQGRGGPEIGPLRLSPRNAGRSSPSCSHSRTPPPTPGCPPSPEHVSADFELAMMLSRLFQHVEQCGTLGEVRLGGQIVGRRLDTQWRSRLGCGQVGPQPFLRPRDPFDQNIAAITGQPTERLAT